MKIPDEHLREVCKIGQGNECCRYILCGRNGFECGKRDTLKKFIDDQVLGNEMAAQGDNCDGKL